MEHAVFYGGIVLPAPTVIRAATVQFYAVIDNARGTVEEDCNSIAQLFATGGLHG